MKKSLQRTIRAHLRDLRVLFQESRNALILFGAVVLSGALIFRFFSLEPGTQQHPVFSKALYGTLSLIFFNSEVLGFPEEWYLQALLFLIPVLGLAAGADSVLRLGSALVNKAERGQKWQVAMASTYSNHVIICGFGKVGYRTALELLKFGREVVAIERNADGRFVEQAKALGIPIIIADARRSENLLKAGIKAADVVITCTDDELANLDISLDARELNPSAKVVMRLFDPELARRVEKGFGIQTALSTSALAAPIFAAAAMRLNVQHAFYVGQQLLSLSELVVQPDSPLVGWTVQKMEVEFDVSAICHQQGGCTDLHPDRSRVLGAGDKVLVLASLDVLRRLHDLNGADL